MENNEVNWDEGPPLTNEELLRPLPFGRGNSSLWKLKYEVDDSRFVRILGNIARLIQRSMLACERAAASGPREYAEMVADSEASYTEELIGAAFLILQAKIRRVTKAAIDLAEEMKSHHQGFSSRRAESDAKEVV
jgi:hypothetical protein